MTGIVTRLLGQVFEIDLLELRQEVGRVNQQSWLIHLLLAHWRRGQIRAIRLNHETIHGHAQGGLSDGLGVLKCDHP